MLAKDDTKLEIFGFGEENSDKFYCLVNLKMSPNGIDLKKLSLADPRKFDEELNKMGCILLLWLGSSRSAQRPPADAGQRASRGSR